MTIEKFCMLNHNERMMLHKIKSDMHVHACSDVKTYIVGLTVSSSCCESGGGSGDIQVFSSISQEVISDKLGASITYSIVP